MFEKKQNEFSRQDGRPTKNVVRLVGGPTPEEEIRSCLGCLGVCVVACIIGGSILFAGACIMPRLELNERCEAVGVWVDSTISSCHPEGHECQFCDRNREDEEGK